MHVVVMLPYERGRTIIKKHRLLQFSEGRENFYNGPCFQVTLENANDLDEILKTLAEAYGQQNT